MANVNIKPLTVNRAWKGRKYKTREYIKYERDCLMLLPKISIPDGKLKLNLVFGFSNPSCDTDNPVKMFVDILQKKYTFNDSRIYKYEIEKKIVKKGEEFISFIFEPY